MDLETAQRIRVERVEPQTHDEEVRFERDESLQAVLELGEVLFDRRPDFEGHVDGRALSSRRAGLVFRARVVGKLVLAVDADVQDGGVGVEDLLRAVAVVEVDVEDPDGRGGRAVGFPRRDCERGVVDVAVATRPLSVAVVAWRSAQRDDRVDVAGQVGKPREHVGRFACEVRRGEDGLVARGHDAAAHVEGVVSSPCEWVLGRSRALTRRGGVDETFGQDVAVFLDQVGLQPHLEDVSQMMQIFEAVSLGRELHQPSFPRFIFDRAELDRAKLVGRASQGFDYRFDALWRL